MEIVFIVTLVGIVMFIAGFIYGDIQFDSLFRQQNIRYEKDEIMSLIYKVEQRQMDFLVKAHDILKTVMDNDKKKMMYELMEEDIELIEEGRKIKAIRKILG